MPVQNRDPNIISIGRDLFPNADLMALSQTMSGDNFQLGMTDVFQEVLPQGAVDNSPMIDFVVQLDLTCDVEWQYVIAPDLATAVASASDKWYPVQPNVEKIIPMLEPQGRLFAKLAAGVGPTPLALTAWGFKAPPKKDIPGVTP